MFFLTATLGPAGMAWANYLPLGGIVLMTWGIYSLAPGTFRALVRDTALIYLIPALPFLAAALAGGDRIWLKFALSAGAGAIALLLYAWRFGGEFVRFFRDPTRQPSPPA